MEINEVIASNVKKAREEKGLTLDNAAKITGVSRSMLAQIEKGDVNPTISVIWKIANGYKVSFTSLLEDRRLSEKTHIIPEPTPLIEGDGLYLNYPAFTFDEQTHFETYRIVIQEKGSLSAQPHLKGAQEFITVFSGTVRITVGDEEYILDKGRSIRFMADVPHSYTNVGTGQVQLAMLIYYKEDPFFRC